MSLYNKRVYCWSILTKPMQSEQFVLKKKCTCRKSHEWTSQVTEKIFLVKHTIWYSNLLVIHQKNVNVTIYIVGPCIYAPTYMPSIETIKIHSILYKSSEAISMMGAGLDLSGNGDHLMAKLCFDVAVYGH